MPRDPDSENKAQRIWRQAQQELGEVIESPVFTHCVACLQDQLRLVERAFASRSRSVGAEEQGEVATSERRRRETETRIFCPTRDHYYTLSDESLCPDHGDAATAEIERISVEVAKGRWDRERQDYVPWE